MMQSSEVPKANPENLLAIIRAAQEGKVVIPEFQRRFVWAREDIEEFLVSILEGYFIGTFLILDTPVHKPLFPFRVVEGLNHVNPDAISLNHHTVRLVLDGQQRITSLFYVLYEPPIRLKHAKNPYRFFFRLDLALDADAADAVIGISRADRKRMAEMGKLTQQDRAIPFAKFLDAGAFYRWLYNEQQFLKHEEHKKLIESFYLRFSNFMVPVVALSPETGKDNIVNIFERINRRGVKLSLFDLAVARLYPKGLKLRQLWKDFEKKHRRVARIVKPELLLKVIALLLGKEPRKGTLLDILEELGTEEFQQAWDTAVRAVKLAFERIISPSGGYGAFDKRWIPYTTMIVPLAALLHAVQERGGGETLYRKVDQWYWGSVSLQRYDSAVDSKSYQDFKEVIQWMEKDTPPDWIANFSVLSIDLEVEDRRSAVYRAIMCLIVLNGAKDFIDGQAVNLGKCDDDHIFARSKFSGSKVNCILNRTLISERTNKVKSSKRPSEFLPLFLENHGNDEKRLLETLASHLIPPEAYEALKEDKLEAFIECRRQALTRELEFRVKQR